jgi:hypothetical protein
MLINSVLNYSMSENVVLTCNFLIKLAMLTLAISCKNGCVVVVLKFILFIDLLSYKLDIIVQQYMFNNEP